MKLLEFFGKTTIANKSSEKHNNDFSNDELFWFIVDNDSLHKKHFFPIAKKIKESHHTNKKDRPNFVAEFMPMVKQGCLEFYAKEKMIGKPAKLFPKDLREEMCQRLYDHYYEDVIKGQYNLG